MGNFISLKLGKFESLLTIATDFGFVQKKLIESKKKFLYLFIFREVKKSIHLLHIRVIYRDL
ncbi:hypothetical protein AT272_11925 [Bacillus cereus]|nr:hypothetical protein AT272_11925 [Bacillus cereus]